MGVSGPWKIHENGWTRTDGWITPSARDSRVFGLNQLQFQRRLSVENNLKRAADVRFKQTQSEFLHSTLPS